MSLEKIDPEKEVLAIKILSEYVNINKYIYIIILIDKVNAKIINYPFIISSDYKLLKFLNTNNNILELYKNIEIYNNINKSENEFNKKFQASILAVIQKNINNIMLYHNNNNNIGIIDIFSQTMNKFMDFHIGTYDIEHTVLNIDDINAINENMEQEINNFNYIYDDNSENVESNENKTTTYKLINANFVVDPVGGKLINDIQIGDKVIVSINSNTSDENMIYLELKGKKDKYSKYLVPAEVLEKNVDEKSTKILLKLIEGYCCLIEETEPIKLKIFNPDKDLYNSTNKMGIFKIFVMFGLGAIAVFIIISLILMFLK